jgi:DNA repair exonuclease SbcCD ATPase subunit
MIEKIAHLSDIHIRKSPIRNSEYAEVFENLYKSLRNAKPDRIVLTGDLVDDYLDLQGEQIILASSFLNNLAKIAPVRIIRGNHDMRKSAISRVDSVKAITESIANQNIKYYCETNFFADDNITWCVWNHGDKDANPWKKHKKHQVDANQTYIDLFHDPINGCKASNGFEMNSKSLIKVSDFKGKYGFFGDIHKQQYLDKNKRKAYASSLIAQEFSEGDDEFHGYLLWNIVKDSVEEISVYNKYSYKNVNITPFIDFDDLDFEIDNPTEFMRVRFIWSTLPQTKSKVNVAKITDYIKNKYKGIITVSHKVNFIENTKINNIESKKKLDNISQQQIQHEIFKEYLTKIGCDTKVIEDIIKLDDEIAKRLDIRDTGTGEWNIIKFGGVNFKSYGKIDIDWRDKNGLFQITGLNARGKSSIIGLISYILYSQTLETETRVKYGDSRFVNNRNGATYCEGYCVIESNNQYYGIKRRTDIKRAKDGSINGSPTSLKYYTLKNPDDVMDDSTCIDNLTDDQKNKTQKVIEQIIGSYDNFQRIISTTSDTLNKVLSNDMAEFIDSLLYDSGLDIFDRKLTEFKEFEKNKNSRIRVNCDVEKTKASIRDYEQKNVELVGKIKEHEDTLIPEKEQKIKIGWEFVEKLNKRLYNIDNEVYNLNVDLTKEKILLHKKNISDLNIRVNTLNNLMQPLAKTYDEDLLNNLLLNKDQHRVNEYDLKLKIKNIELEISSLTHKIELINGEIVRLKQDGLSKKNEIIKLRESKTCTMCGQKLLPEHQQHIEDNILVIEKDMFKIADEIKTKQNVDIKNILDKIEGFKSEIEELKQQIITNNLKMESILVEIGELTNKKNDVQKRNEYQLELDNIPTKIKNEELNISILEQKLNNHQNSLLQIEENKKTEITIKQAKDKINLLNTELYDLKENVFLFKNNIATNEAKIKSDNDLIAAFLVQEHEDNVNNLYKSCIHRNGIPTQMLIEYIIPKINSNMESILSKSEFNIWLDSSDLRLKLVYHNRPTSIIDCIGASGKERTFSSIILKFSLNQINVKSKPTMFLLDEVMGKLTDESVNEFIEILSIIKENSNKVLIIEHDKNINPDYIMHVTIDDDGISSVNLN